MECLLRLSGVFFLVVVKINIFLNCFKVSSVFLEIIFFYSIIKIIVDFIVRFEFVCVWG